VAAAAATVLQEKTNFFTIIPFSFAAAAVDDVVVASLHIINTYNIVEHYFYDYVCGNSRKFFLGL